MQVYFSHPTFTYRTKTERIIIKIIEDSFNPDEIINPADLGLRKDPTPYIKGSDKVVGLSISNKFTFIVWNEMDQCKSFGADVYTMMAVDKYDIGPLVSDIPDNVERLSKEDSDIFCHKIMNESRDGFFSILFGNWNRRF